MEMKIFIDGHVDDLYALSLLFPKDAYDKLYVITQIKGEKRGLLDHVTDVNDRTTYVTGEGCAPLFEASTVTEAGWAAHQILAPLNGYAVLADSNYKPVWPISAECKKKGSTRQLVFGEKESKGPKRSISVARHSALATIRNSRLELMTSNPLAASAAFIVSAHPNWAEYYRLLEDIAGDRGTTLDKLTDVGLAERQALDAFKAAANNRTLGRHGTSKRRVDLNQSDLMNLLEAREFIRSVVTKWLDERCGDRMPTDRVDGGPLRFGLDDRKN